MGRKRGKSRETIESCLIRAPVVVNDRLAEVIAVGQWLTVDTSRLRINGFNSKLFAGPSCQGLQFNGKFLFEVIKRRMASGGIGIVFSQFIGSLFDQMRALKPSPRPLPQKSLIYVAKSYQAVEDRVHPVIKRHIR